MLQVFDRVLASQSGEPQLVLMLGVGIALMLLLALDFLRSRLAVGRCGQSDDQGVAAHGGTHHGEERRQRGARYQKRPMTAMRYPCRPCTRHFSA
ncbi:MAG TPA: hypothetical protein VGJ72_01535 [Polaromonas sp.]|jgi:ABC-type protease/lipase transport system fused ATPase/permease subunit